MQKVENFFLKMNQVIIIAEAGQNHNGKLQLAYKLVDVAKKCGADFIRFQTSIPELHISRFAQKANYQIKIILRNVQTHSENNDYKTRRAKIALNSYF